MEKIIELVCDYCGMEISEKNHTCPNCGADCSIKIKKYKEQKRKEEEAKKAEDLKKNQELAKDVKGVASKIAVVFVAIFVFVMAMIIFGISSLSRQARNSEIEFSSGTVNETPKKKKVEVGFNEDAETSKYTVTLDSYELYEYKSDDFPNQFNTPQGYQKIAFHFVYTNTSDNKMYSSSINLTADDYTVEEARMEVGMFEHVVTGKEKYSSVENKYIQSGEKLQGYAGFLVPVDKKVLKFHVGDNITITMDNPAYTE